MALVPTVNGTICLQVSGTDVCSQPGNFMVAVGPYSESVTTDALFRQTLIGCLQTGRSSAGSDETCTYQCECLHDQCVVVMVIPQPSKSTSTKLCEVTLC